MIFFIIFYFFNGDFSLPSRNFDEWKINIVIKHMACVCTGTVHNSQEKENEVEVEEEEGE